MDLAEAFEHQIENTRPLTEEDLTTEFDGPIVWNGVIIRGDNFFYSSGRRMQVGETLLAGYVVKNTASPKPILLERTEVTKYESILKVIRVVDHIPVLMYKDQSDDQYADTDEC